MTSLLGERMLPRGIACFGATGTGPPSFSFLIDVETQRIQAHVANVRSETFVKKKDFA